MAGLTPCATLGCTLPDQHAGFHCFALISASRVGKRKRQPATQCCDDEVESDDDCESTGAQGRARRVNQKPNGEEPELTVAQAKAQARAEGLVLLPRADTASGFKGVYRHGGRFKAETPRNGGKQ
eukprot:3245911-Prymnesium_polylepis.1